MKHHLLTTICLSGMVLAAVSCDNYDDLYPQEYEKILMLKDAGEQSVTLYTTDEATPFQISIMKTGSNTTLAANATLRPMTAEELAAYSEEYGTSRYAAVPGNCFSFSETENTNSLTLDYAGTDLYKLVNVYLDPEEIHAFSETLTDVQEAVIPLVLVSENDSVSNASNRLFILPETIVPTIYFEVSGFKQYGLQSNSNGNAEVRIPITMPIENRWDFNCTVELDNDLLIDYNAANGTNYLLLPTTMYSGLQPTYSFAQGSNTVNITVEVDKDQLDWDDEYILPIRLTSSSLEGLDIDATRGYCLAAISCKVDLTLDMLSTNSECSNGDGTFYDGVGLIGLIDGDSGSDGLFHTDWYYDYSDATYGHYVDFHLNTPVSQFKFDFKTRNENSNSAPTVVELYTSTDGVTWTKLTTVNTELTASTGGGKWSSYGSYTSSAEFTYLRFAVIENVKGYDLRQFTLYNSCWNCQEFVLYAK